MLDTSLSNERSPLQNLGLFFSPLLFLQKVEVLKYTDEEYEKYLIDPVGTNQNKK